VPFALPQIKGSDPAKLARARRTCSGVMLAHEIRPVDVFEAHERNLATLYEFGYGTPATRVFNYWQPDGPVRVSRADTAFLVVTKPGSMLVLVSDYGEGGEVVLTLDRTALGLKGGIAAIDTETGKRVDVTPDGAVRFMVPKHDFCLIRIEGSAGERP
jgi:hypothetical protein